MLARLVSLPGVVVPAGQKEQALAPLVAAYWPCRHGRHAVPRAYCPGRHTTLHAAGLAAPTAVVVVPAGHCAHAAWPADDVYCPSGQGAQGWPYAYWPAGHCTLQLATDLPPVVTVVVPPGHMEQFAKLARPLYVPVAQVTHVIWYGLECCVIANVSENINCAYVPVPHGEHPVEEVSPRSAVVVPMSHDWHSNAWLLLE